MGEDYKNNYGSGGGKKPKKGLGAVLIIIIAIIMTFAAVAFINNAITKARYKETPYNEFYTKLKNSEVDTVSYKDSTIQYTLKSEASEGAFTFKHIYYTGQVPDYDLVPLLKEKGVTINGYIPNNSGSIVSFLPVSYTHLTLSTKRIV